MAVALEVPEGMLVHVVPFWPAPALALRLKHAPQNADAAAGFVYIVTG